MKYTNKVGVLLVAMVLTATLGSGIAEARVLPELKPNLEVDTKLRTQAVNFLKSSSLETPKNIYFSKLYKDPESYKSSTFKYTQIVKWDSQKGIDEYNYKVYINGKLSSTSVVYGNSLPLSVEEGNTYKVKIQAVKEYTIKEGYEEKVIKRKSGYTKAIKIGIPLIIGGSIPYAYTLPDGATEENTQSYFFAFNYINSEPVSITHTEVYPNGGTEKINSWIDANPRDELNYPDVDLDREKHTFTIKDKTTDVYYLFIGTSDKYTLTPKTKYVLYLRTLDTGFNYKIEIQNGVVSYYKI